MFHVKRNILIFVKNLGEVLIDMIHNEEDAWGLFPALNFRNNDILEPDSEDVVLHGGKAAENRDFSINSLGAVDAVKGVLDIFDGHGLFC